MRQALSPIPSEPTPTAPPAEESLQSLGLLVGLGWAGLCAANTLHALAFFYIIDRLGAVGSGVLKGLQTVLVFAFSAVFYCQFQVRHPVYLSYLLSQRSQCFSQVKAASVLLVLVGTLVFARAKQRNNAQ
jgi:hypothetical protein